MARKEGVEQLPTKGDVQTAEIKLEDLVREYGPKLGEAFFDYVYITPKDEKEQERKREKFVRILVTRDGYLSAFSPEDRKQVRVLTVLLEAIEAKFEFITPQVAKRSS